MFTASRGPACRPSQPSTWPMNDSSCIAYTDFRIFIGQIGPVEDGASVRRYDSHTSSTLCIQPGLHGNCSEQPIQREVLCPTRDDRLRSPRELDSLYRYLVIAHIHILAFFLCRGGARCGRTTILQSSSWNCCRCCLCPRHSFHLIFQVEETSLTLAFDRSHRLRSSRALKSI